MKGKTEIEDAELKDVNGGITDVQPKPLTVKPSSKTVETAVSGFVSPTVDENTISE